MKRDVFQDNGNTDETNTDDDGPRGWDETEKDPEDKETPKKQDLVCLSHEEIKKGHETEQGEEGQIQNLVITTKHFFCFFKTITKKN